MQWHNNSAPGSTLQILTLIALLAIPPSIVLAQSQPTAKPVSSHNKSITTRKVIRLGTAIPPSNTDNSIRINSEDAGPILPYHAYSGCINCGVREIYPLNYGHTLQAITGGIIGGTIANKVGKHFDTSPRSKNSRLLGGQGDAIRRPILNQPFIPQVHETFQ